MSLKHHQYGQNAINLELWQGPHLPNVQHYFCFAVLLYHKDGTVKRSLRG